MRERREITELVDQITRRFKPEKVILFGSHAYGRPKKDSDIDLMVIMNTRKNTLDAAAEVRCAVQHSFPIDIIVRTPKQIERRLKWGDSFIREVTEKGRVLYEAPG